MCIRDRDRLVGLSHDFAQVTAQLGVGVGEERHGSTGSTSTACSSNTVDVVLDVAWHVVVNHVGDTFNVCDVSTDCFLSKNAPARMVYEEARSSMSIDYRKHVYLKSQRQAGKSVVVCGQ